MAIETIGDNTTDDWPGCEDVGLWNATNHNGQDLWMGSGYYTLIKFSGLSNISSSATIDAATIFLYSLGGQSPTGNFRRLLRDWIETEATVNVYSTGNSWTSSGGSSQGNDVSATISSAYSGDGSIGYHSATDPQFVDDVQDFVDGTYSNYGWNLITATNWDFFEDSEGADGQRPYLSVTYSIGDINTDVTVSTISETDIVYDFSIIADYDIGVIVQKISESDTVHNLNIIVDYDIDIVISKISESDSIFGFLITIDNDIQIQKITEINSTHNFLIIANEDIDVAIEKLSENDSVLDFRVSLGQVTSQGPINFRVVVKQPSFGIVMKQPELRDPVIKQPALTVVKLN